MSRRSRNDVPGQPRKVQTRDVPDRIVSIRSRFLTPTTRVKTVCVMCSRRRKIKEYSLSCARLGWTRGCSKSVQDESCIQRKTSALRCLATHLQRGCAPQWSMLVASRTMSSTILRRSGIRDRVLISAIQSCPSSVIVLTVRMMANVPISPKKVSSNNRIQENHENQARSERTYQAESGLNSPLCVLLKSMRRAASKDLEPLIELKRP